MTISDIGSDRAARIVQGILSCYDRLSRFESLEPSPELNDVFEELVGLCSRVLDEDTVAEVSEVAPRRKFPLPDALSRSYMIPESRGSRHICGSYVARESSDWKPAGPVR